MAPKGFLGESYFGYVLACHFLPMDEVGALWAESTFQPPRSTGGPNRSTIVSLSYYRSGYRAYQGVLLTSTTNDRPLVFGAEDWLLDSKAEQGKFPVKQTS